MLNVYGKYLSNSIRAFSISALNGLSNGQVVRKLKRFVFEFWISDTNVSRFGTILFYDSNSVAKHYNYIKTYISKIISRLRTKNEKFISSYNMKQKFWIYVQYFIDFIINIMYKSILFSYSASWPFWQLSWV